MYTQHKREEKKIASEIESNIFSLYVKRVNSYLSIETKKEMGKEYSLPTHLAYSNGNFFLSMQSELTLHVFLEHSNPLRKQIYKPLK